MRSTRLSRWWFRFKHYTLELHHRADNGNCWTCGFRAHGGHVEPYADWAKK